MTPKKDDIFLYKNCSSLDYRTVVVIQANDKTERVEIDDVSSHIDGMCGFFVSYCELIEIEK